MADEKIKIVECCGSAVRWVPLSSMQANRRRLQQQWSIYTYRGEDEVLDGEATRKEWRDVPMGMDGN